MRGGGGDAQLVRVTPVAWRDVPTAARASAATTSSPHGKRERRPRPLRLTTRCFTALWMTLLALHALHAAFLLACARLYWYLEHPYLSYYADLIAPASARHFRLFGSILGVVGALSAVESLGLVCASLRARQPAVLSVSTASLALRMLLAWSSRWCQWRRRSVQPPPPPSRAEAEASLPSLDRSGRLTAAIQRGLDLLSLQSSHFGAVFTVREVVQIGAQVVQCYSFSQVIVRPWINHVLVALVALNCASTALLYPLLRRWDAILSRVASASDSLLARRQVPQPILPPTAAAAPTASPTLARLLCVLVDCLLNVGTSILLPAAVFLPYARAYDPAGFTFPLALLYSDTAFLSLVRENQALFARSVLDAAYKLVPHVNVLFCLLVIAGELRGAEIVARSPGDGAVHPADGSIRPILGPPSSMSRRASAPQALLQHQDESEKRPSAPRLRRLAVATAFLGVGLCAIALHLQAMLAHSALSDSAAGMCLQPVYPWFSSRHSCAVVQFNCYRQNVSTPGADAFDEFDASGVAAIIFAHCPALVVPPAVRSFGNLLGLEIYNSTITEWSVDAALTNERHPDMIFLILVMVDMAELPPGVLQAPFPAKLGDIELSVTNLTALPASLPDVWADVTLVYLEHSLLTDLPHELLAIPALSELSVIGNDIAQLAGGSLDLLATSEFSFLALGSNPIASLPPTIRPGLSFGFLSLEVTAVSELPAWVGDAVSEGLYLSGSPLCSSAVAELDAVASTGCTERDDRGDGRYPLAIVAPLREL